MKLRTQRVLITLLAFLTVGIASVNAYTFNVVNRTPFGVLNLEKLILKPDTTHTGIIIDGSEYKIKIDPYHEIADGGQIRVYQICDENGDNCKNISDLGAGGSGSNIIINTTGNQYQYCYTTDGQHLYCDQTVGNATITLKNSSGNIIDSFNVNATGDKEITIQGGGNGGGITISGSYINNYICWRSNNSELTCNRLKLSTKGNAYIMSGGLCYVNNDQTLICNQENLFDELSGRIVDVNNGSLMIYDGSSTTYKIFTANQTGTTTVNLVPEGSSGQVCVKNNLGYISCNTVNIGTMANGKVCTYSGGANKINCNTSILNPGSAIITLQTKSGDVVNRSGSFDVNQTTNKTITIPSGGGGVPGQKGDKGDPGENGVSVTNAYIDGNNIVFELSDNSTITLYNALRKGDQGPKGDTGAVGPSGPAGTGISSVTTGKNGKITTVTFNYTNGAPSTSFQISDGADGNGGSGINVEGTPDGRCQYQCGNGSINITWNCSNLNGEERVHCDTDMGKYQQECGNTEITGDCKQNAKNIYSDHPTWLTLTYNNGSDCSIVCDQSEPSCQGQCTGGSGDTIINGIQVTYYSGGKVCRYMDQRAVDNLKNLLDFNPGEISGSGEIRCIFEDEKGGNGGGISIARDPAPEVSGYCVYVDENTIRCNAEGGQGGKNTIINIYTGNNYVTGDTINIYSGGDSLWTSGTRGVSTKDTKDVYFDGNNVSYKNSLSFFGYNGNNTNKNRTLYLDTAGARIGAYAYTGVGLGVVGAIGLGNFQAGCDYNRITIFASGNTQTGNFEILGNTRILVGVGGGGYMYYAGNNFGLNTTEISYSTLNINGSIKIGNCGAMVKCGSATAGEIRYIEKNNNGFFIGCKKINGNQAGTNNNANYARVNLDNGTLYTETITNNDTCYSNAPYNATSYSQIGLQTPGQCTQ